MLKMRRAMIFVKDLDRMRAFYSAMLGLHPVNAEWTDRFADFEAGGVRFALHAIPPEAASDIEIATPPSPRERSPVKLTFEVADVDQERSRLAALGATMLQRPWGGWEGVDPEGNIFGLCRPGE
jgi:catechol 2,3-dioxygenase-like lactoylglutathione lyase family enzyme